MKIVRCQFKAKLLTVLAGLLFTAELAHSETESANSQIRIAKIEIIGLRRTTREVVDQELSITAGDTLKQDEIDESIQRLRNIQIFSKVEYELASASSSLDKVLRISVEERWTTIPIFKFSGGGGVTKVALGGYDVNLLGMYLEAGAQYERLGSENSGVVWFRHPRFLGKRLELFVSFWDTVRSDTVYGDLGKSESIEGALLVKRRKAAFSLEKEVYPWLKAGLTFDYNMDSCDPNLLGVKSTAERSAILKDHVQTTTAVLPGTIIKVGRINYNGFLSDGILFEHRAQFTDKSIGATTNFTSNEMQLLGYRTLGGRSTVAMRLGAGFSDAHVSQYYYFLGGLDRIRGYDASRFYGKSYWLSNFEYRIPILERPTYVIQPTIFTDTVGVAIDRRDLDQVVGASVGAGVRLIAPKIYRLVLRIDYAYPLVGKSRQPINFGIQQFF